MGKNQRICVWCAGSFFGSQQALYCSPECYKKHRNAMRRQGKLHQAADNSQRYANLIRYVHENNLIEIFKKYKNITGAAK